MPSPLPTIKPKYLHPVSDDSTANKAYQSITQGNHLLWTGDYHNGVQLLSALKRRIDRKRKQPPASIDAEAFHRYRMFQSQKASLLNRLLVAVGPDYALELKRAPELKNACEIAFGPLAKETLVPLRMIQGALSAYAWQNKGVDIPALPEPISVRYGVFSPIRGEYLNLIKTTELPPDTRLAFDIGTGSGVIAAILALRGIPKIIATDTNEDAILCATENFMRLGVQTAIRLEQTDLFPSQHPLADLIVCNPPWIPARPTSPIETAVYDPDNAMLEKFLSQAVQHLNPNGQVWLVMSNLAELVKLRPQDFIPQLAEKHGLRVIDRLDTRPGHAKTKNTHDPLHEARAREVTSLWKLTPSQRVAAKL
ncbi:MAG TPA: methyltransferase [Pusillimonas sp.]|jgi:methylase of polypeptide subunit release factors|nr:methyltransferase [Pusillimonas sp.]MBC41949.1 methyltransferase [Pusillimonas sp.]HBT33332.1 methyltransferase [Pusillimonas sp.]|tara:strand:- start:29795 stop:30892 length:1098 start_codon:yes stop_codon:yes gene_type:complete